MTKIFYTINIQVEVGLGFNINFPVSSHDILKSAKTDLVLDVIIEGATTLLCIPKTNRRIKSTAAIVKNLWFLKDWTNETSWVAGSTSQVYAPKTVLHAITSKSILHLAVVGWSWDMTSVSLLSKAFKSSQAVCSSDIFSKILKNCPVN